MSKCWAMTWSMAACLDGSIMPVLLGAKRPLTLRRFHDLAGSGSAGTNSGLGGVNRSSRLDLPPRRRSAARAVAAGQMLGHHALLPLGHQVFEKGLARADYSLRKEHSRQRPALQEFLQSRASGLQGLGQQRPAPVIEQIEDHVANREATAGPADALRAG